MNIDLDNVILSPPTRMIAKATRHSHRIILNHNQSYKQLNVDTLINLKKKIIECQKTTNSHMKALYQRLDHLQNPDQQQLADRLVSEYLIRQGYKSATKSFAQSEMENLIDSYQFRIASRVLDSVEKGNCSKALKWCAQNSQDLARIQSNLENELRQHEFLLLVEQDCVIEAVEYARRYFDPSKMEFASEIMGFLAIGAGKLQQHPSFQQYLPNLRLERIRASFIEAIMVLNGLTRRPLLEILVETGLSAFKTPQCGSCQQCPSCWEVIRDNLDEIPALTRQNSVLICGISREIMDENNMPMALPNGHVYGRNALRKMAENNRGVITCPETMESFRYDECRIAYFL